MNTCWWCKRRMSGRGRHRCAPRKVAEVFALQKAKKLRLPITHRAVRAIAAAWVDGFGHHQFFGKDAGKVPWKLFASPT